MYYSKTLLRELGWSDDEIESLDERVASGEYTFQDMLDTAAEVAAWLKTRFSSGPTHFWRRWTPNRWAATGVDQGGAARETPKVSRGR